MVMLVWAAIWIAALYVLDWATNPFYDDGLESGWAGSEFWPDEDEE